MTASKLLLTLVTMLCLAGCQSILPTQTGAIEQKMANNVCSVWKPVTYSSRDTDHTQLEARANNAAQKAFCSKH